LDYTVCVNLAAPPRNGQANKELVQYMRAVLEVKNHQISFVSGGKSREKVVGIDKGIYTDDKIVELINREFGNS